MVDLVAEVDAEFRSTTAGQFKHRLGLSARGDRRLVERLGHGGDRQHPGGTQQRRGIGIEFGFQRLGIDLRLGGRQPARGDDGLAPALDAIRLRFRF